MSFIGWSAFLAAIVVLGVAMFSGYQRDVKLCEQIGAKHETTGRSSHCVKPDGSMWRIPR